MNFKKFSILLAAIALFVSTLACGSTAPAGVSNIYMANDAEGKNKTSTFAPTDVIYVFFDVNQVDNGSQFQVRWFALNVDGQDPNEAFLTTDYTYNGEPTIYAQIESTQGGFPAAQYKVEIYLAGAKVGEQQFSIQ
ncbi:MAG: hypothetical protein K8S20_17995 [Chloroflexi bacterium]|nr:hypothetical protein [Chloroflexota bacterium]